MRTSQVCYAEAQSRSTARSHASPEATKAKLAFEHLLLEHFLCTLCGILLGDH